MEQEHIARIKAHCSIRFVDLSGKPDLLIARRRCSAALGCSSRSIPRQCISQRPGALPRWSCSAPPTPFTGVRGPTPAGFAGGKSRASDRIRPQAARRPDEPNLDGKGDRCYGIAAVGSGGTRAMSKQSAKPRKSSESLWQTIRIGWRPYRRLYSYVKPYKLAFHPRSRLRLPLRHDRLAHAARPRQGGRRRLPRRHAPGAQQLMPRTRPLLNDGPEDGSAPSCSASPFRRS